MNFEFTKGLQRNINRKANNQNFAKIAKITAVLAGGQYDVETSNGVTMNGVVSVAYSIKFQVGQWVTLEFFGGDWVIAGIAAHKGGD